MEFNINKVYTAVNADELPIESKRRGRNKMIKMKLVCEKCNLAISGKLIHGAQQKEK